MARQVHDTAHVGLPADEAYETELDLNGNPSRLRLISEWRREIHQGPEHYKHTNSQQRHGQSTSRQAQQACGHHRVQPKSWPVYQTVNAAHDR